VVDAVKSWQLGARLRIAKRAARRVMQGSIAWLALRRGSRPRRMARRLGVGAIRYLLARPLLARPARRLLRHFPAIRGRLRMMLLVPAGPYRVHVNVADLSENARAIYAELKVAVARRAGRR
jgi:hypothetical protein